MPPLVGGRRRPDEEVDHADRSRRCRRPQSRRRLPTSRRASISSYPVSWNIRTCCPQHWAIPLQRRAHSSSDRACLCPHLATPPAEYVYNEYVYNFRFSLYIYFHQAYIFFLP